RRSGIARAPRAAREGAQRAARAIHATEAAMAARERADPVDSNAQRTDRTGAYRRTAGGAAGELCSGGRNPLWKDPGPGTPAQGSECETGAASAGRTDVEGAGRRGRRGEDRRQV